MGKVKREPASFRLASTTKRLLPLLADKGESQADVIDRLTWSAARDAGLVLDWTDEEVAKARAEKRAFVARCTYPVGEQRDLKAVAEQVETLDTAIQTRWFGHLIGWGGHADTPSYLEIHFVLPPEPGVELKDRRHLPGLIQSALYDCWHRIVPEGHVSIQRLSE